MAFMNDAMRNALAAQLKVRIQAMVQAGDHDANTISRSISDKFGRDDSGAYQLGAPTANVGNFAMFGGPFGGVNVGP